MARIRVNTEDLNLKSQGFESAADAFSRAGDDIAATAAALPSLKQPAPKEFVSKSRYSSTAFTWSGSAFFLAQTDIPPEGECIQ